MRQTLAVTVAVCAALAALASADDNKPQLSLPKANLCSNRQKHFFHRGHSYLFSWRANAQPETWFHARNYCRDRCMDLVSMETGEENELMKNIVQEGTRNGQSIWTSGRLCNFNDDCKRPDLNPIRINGWFWATPRVRMLPSDQKTPFSANRAVNDWSSAGRCGAQPDQCDNRVDEACMTIGNNLFGDGIKWHDETCHMQKHFICEDSDELINFVRFNNRGINL
ncbi:uncharacterized protein LOC122368156 [Amphibalanus amphitrite]|uniref:uncharacterized protein LOC122368156 n=1 Tax=Amphibalanus amphitrite TaxID=1232801 RepID=UPI001C9205AE|nr:uncharacterized protein LOC122368156 [Amphibalanus amphitrite]